MKHGKNLTVAQRKFLISKGIHWQNWLIINDAPDKMVIRHRNLDIPVRVVHKGGSYA